MTDADLLRRILGAMRPDVPLDMHDNAWLAAKGLDTLEAIEAAAAGVTAVRLIAAGVTLDPRPAQRHGVGMVDKVGITCLCDADFSFASGGWPKFNEHLVRPAPDADALDIALTATIIANGHAGTLIAEQASLLAALREAVKAVITDLSDHRPCGKPYAGCYSHLPIPHCRACGMTTPCDGELASVRLWTAVGRAALEADHE